MSKPPKELVDAVVASLKEGRGWRFDQYTAQHYASGIEVWTSNGIAGLHLRTLEAQYGGVTFASVFFGWLIPWRRKLLNAARKASKIRSMARIAEYKQKLGVA